MKRWWTDVVDVTVDHVDGRRIATIKVAQWYGEIDQFGRPDAEKLPGEMRYALATWAAFPDTDSKDPDS